VRQGVNLAALNKEYTYIAYFDADLATPLSEINLMKSIVDNNQELIMVLCSRIKRLGASVNRNKKRHLLGRVFSTFASSILKLPVYDTQCGAKLIKAEIVPFTFNTPFLTSWIFDVEILARIRNGRKDKVTKVLYEHPVTQWEDIGGSKLKFKHMLKVPLELFKIKQFYNK
jgi:dolichyl-phosphate beta-glucosyltransferase